MPTAQEYIMARLTKAERDVERREKELDRLTRAVRVHRQAKLSSTLDTTEEADLDLWSAIESDEDDRILRQKRGY